MISAQTNQALLPPSQKPIKKLTLLTQPASPHDDKIGLNPLVDAAWKLFSLLSKINEEQPDSLKTFQMQLVKEIQRFNNNSLNEGYPAPYLLACRYVLCATFDDCIANTHWGQAGDWETFSLLKAFKEDPGQKNKFFHIIQQALSEPGRYIDMMEFLYLCFSLGYKLGPTLKTAQLSQIEQIKDHLYQHIRAYRGQVSKHLSLPLLASGKRKFLNTKNSASLSNIFFITAGLIFSLCLVIGLVTDIFSNETFSSIATFHFPPPSALVSHAS